MRQLWTKDLVTYRGRWHAVTDAGLNPLPVQQPIPIWFGGGSEQVMKRVARLGDGWFPLFRPDRDGRDLVQRVRNMTVDEGRNPDDIGIESWVSIGGRPQNEWMADVEAWDALGASHISVNTMKAGLDSPQDHIDAIAKFKDAVG